MNFGTKTIALYLSIANVIVPVNAADSTQRIAHIMSSLSGPYAQTSALTLAPLGFTLPRLQGTAHASPMTSASAKQDSIRQSVNAKRVKLLRLAQERLADQEQLFLIIERAYKNFENDHLVAYECFCEKFIEGEPCIPLSALHEEQKKLFLAFDRFRESLETFKGFQMAEKIAHHNLEALIFCHDKIEGHLRTIAMPNDERYQWIRCRKHLQDLCEKFSELSQMYFGICEFMTTLRSPADLDHERLIRKFDNPRFSPWALGNG